MAQASTSKGNIATKATKRAIKVLGMFKVKNTSHKTRTSQSSSTPLTYSNFNDSQDTLTDVSEHRQSKLRSMLKKLKRRSKKHVIPSSKTKHVEWADDDADERTLCDIDVEPQEGKAKMTELEQDDVLSNSWQDLAHSCSPAPSTPSLIWSTPSTPKDSTELSLSMTFMSIREDDADDAMEIDWDNAMDIDTETVGDSSIGDDTLTAEEFALFDTEMDKLAERLAGLEITDGTTQMWAMYLSTEQPSEQAQVSRLSSRLSESDSQLTFDVAISPLNIELDRNLGLTVPTSNRKASLAMSHVATFAEHDNAQMDCSPDPFGVHECKDLLCPCCYLPPLVRNLDLDWEMKDNTRKGRRKHRVPSSRLGETFCGITVEEIFRPKKSRLPASRQRVFGPYVLSHRRHPVTKV